MAACGAEETVCEAPVAATTEATACEPKYVKNKTITWKKIKMKKMKAKMLLIVGQNVRKMMLASMLPG